MNRFIAALVGALAAFAVLLGGVHAAKGDQRPVSESHLETYASN